MPTETRTYAAATCSWIDKATGLPEVDSVPITFSGTTRSFLVGNAGYRFCNFMEVWVRGDFRSGTMSGRGFSEASGIYRGPSFGKIPSHVFPRQTEIVDEADAIRFTQVVGARTVSPEVLGAGGGIVGGAIVGGVIGSAVPVIGTAVGAVVGGVVGAVSGEVLGHQIKGFPPIWTKLQVRVFKNGTITMDLLQHSIFPSLTVFRQTLQPDGSFGPLFERVDYAPGVPYYNATKNVQLPDWQDHAWGQLPASSATGPSRGNPWGVTKGVTGGSEIVPG